MIDIIVIILPVFVLIGAGYASVYFKFLSYDAAETLTEFVQKFAIPCLLFNAVVSLDIAAVFETRLFLSYYIPALSIFFIGMIIARLFFHRTPAQSVSIAFTGLFSNMVLLGLPIMERAYGTGSLSTNYALISVHVPFCYVIGITFMEVLRADGIGPVATSKAVLKAVFKNNLTIGLLLGFAVNFSGLTLPNFIQTPISMMAQSSLPLALFSLGGVIVRYEVIRNIPEVASVTLVKLILFPLLAYLVATYVFDLPNVVRNSVVITAAMPPGINTYIFASLYNRGKASAASSVVICTGLSIMTISAWLAFLT